MRTAVPTALLGLALALGIGCGEVRSNSAEPSRPGGSGPSGPGSTPGGNGNNPGGGSSGPGSPNPGGGPSTPGGPPLALPDAGADGAASADTGTSAPGAMAGCQVSITALNPPRFDNLLAGSTSRLRVQARVSGDMAPAKPDWQWQVQLGPLSEVAVTKLTPEGDVVEFPLASEGSYTIRASASPNCPVGSANAGASRPDSRMTTYWARVTPPRETRLPTHDALISIGGSSPPVKPISLSPGITVSLDPKNFMGQAIRSYIRISSRASSVRFEGNTLALPFQVDLLAGRPYDVLIVPEGDVAPVLLADRTATQLKTEPLVFDAGYAMTGTVQQMQPGGVQAVAGARVFLRSDALLPSSIGQTTATGSFELRARAGNFQVSVLPPAGTGLPEARLPEASRLPLVQTPSFQLTYAAIQTAAVEVRVRSSDGQRPVAGARVRLDADPASLGTIGSFRLADGPDIAALGAVRAEAMTDAAGTASFPRLPRGRYRALVGPPAAMSDAATTAAPSTSRRRRWPPP